MLNLRNLIFLTLACTFNALLGMNNFIYTTEGRKILFQKIPNLLIKDLLIKKTSKKDPLKFFADIKAFEKMFMAQTYHVSTEELEKIASKNISDLSEEEQIMLNINGPGELFIIDSEKVGKHVYSMIEYESDEKTLNALCEALSRTRACNKEIRKQLMMFCAEKKKLQLKE